MDDRRGVIRFLVWYLDGGDWNISIGYDLRFAEKFGKEISIRHDEQFLTKGWARGGGLKIEEDSRRVLSSFEIIREVERNFGILLFSYILFLFIYFWDNVASFYFALGTKDNFKG